MQTIKWLSFEWQTMLSQSAYRWGVHVWHTPLFSLPILPNTVTVKNISFWYTLTHSTIFFRHVDTAFTHVGTASLLSDRLSVSWAFSLLVTYLYHLWGIAFTPKIWHFCKYCVFKCSSNTFLLQLHVAHDGIWNLKYHRIHPSIWLCQSCTWNIILYEVTTCPLSFHFCHNTG